MEEHRRITGTDEEIKQEINSLMLVNGEDSVTISSVDHIDNSTMEVWVTLKPKQR